MLYKAFLTMLFIIAVGAYGFDDWRFWLCAMVLALLFPTHRKPVI